MDVLVFEEVAFEEPEEIEVAEFGKQVFAIVLVIVDIMCERTMGLAVFKNREIVFALPLGELDLDVVVHAETKAEQTVHQPAKLVIMHRRYNAQQACIVEKLTGHLFHVELESFHTDWLWCLAGTE